MGNHLEGETCVVFYTKNADTNDPGNIVALARKSDIAVMLICNIHHIKPNVWYDSEDNQENIRECLGNVQNISSLPALYAFLGNNYTYAFFTKGKVNPRRQP